ncbi:GyrI-like domain-containing protein [Bacillus paralicheniformis]|uniref:GyrI-like domain-containing protein n=1 Tax=Bacillus paralicheniformis TaxID=1648923 RepID=UPI00227E6572|nr:GyrI-like domain-containing protein [Bacillus paralicheniformis]MCY8040264.1 GyrI-like domain-containing protein [Bacillus paralicheniformis]
MEIKKTAKPGFVGVGFSQTVSFEEAQAKKLHGVIQQLKDRRGEIVGVQEDSGMWAISDHHGEGEFTFYILMETENLPETLPEGMISYQAPALTYAQTRHPQHERPEVTYQKVYQWIKDQGLRLNCDTFTQLEFYPMDGDLNELAFEIYIPIH